MRQLAILLFLAISPLMAQDPADARGWLNRGIAEFKAARYPEAVAAFQKAAQAEPSNVTFRLYLGTAWMAQYIPGADTEENRAFAGRAAQEFLAVLGLDAKNVQALSSLASLSLNQKHWEEAQQWCERVIAVDPDNSAAWYSMGFLAWSKVYLSLTGARQSLGIRLEDPGPLPAGAIKDDLKSSYAAVIESGLRALREALRINPKYDDAMAYTNLLIRERADLRDTAAEYQQDIAEADDWVQKAIEAKRAKAPQESIPRGAAHTISITAPSLLRTWPAPPPQPPHESRPTQHIDLNVRMPKLVKRAPPVYPANLEVDSGVEGVVRLQVKVGKDGHVAEIKLVDGHPLLVPAAIDAVRQWVYEPALVNGQPAELTIQEEVKFVRPH